MVTTQWCTRQNQGGTSSKTPCHATSDVPPSSLLRRRIFCHDGICPREWEEATGDEKSGARESKLSKAHDKESTNTTHCREESRRPNPYHARLRARKRRQRREGGQQANAQQCNEPDNKLDTAVTTNTREDESDVKSQTSSRRRGTASMPTHQWQNKHGTSFQQNRLPVISHGNDGETGAITWRSYSLGIAREHMHKSSNQANTANANEEEDDPPTERYNSWGLNVNWTNQRTRERGRNDSMIVQDAHAVAAETHTAEGGDEILQLLQEAVHVAVSQGDTDPSNQRIPSTEASPEIERQEKSERDILGHTTTKAIEKGETHTSHENRCEDERWKQSEPADAKITPEATITSSTPEVYTIVTDDEGSYCSHHESDNRCDNTSVSMANDDIRLTSVEEWVGDLDVMATMGMQRTKAEDQQQGNWYCATSASEDQDHPMQQEMVDTTNKPCSTAPVPG